MKPHALMVQNNGIAGFMKPKLMHSPELLRHKTLPLWA